MLEELTSPAKKDNEFRGREFTFHKKNALEETLEDKINEAI